MSERQARRLLRAYPRAWRARYGAELVALLTELSADRPVCSRMRLDVVRAGLAERLHATGLGSGAPPAARARSGALLVLCAWMVFAVAGARVQKFSEHWQGATPQASRGVPSVAFDVLEVAAALGGALVLAGIALALPRTLAYIRSGGWPVVRHGVVRASALTAIAIGATAALAVWAHQLGTPQRNGASSAYSTAFVLCALLLAVALAAWTSVAVSLARGLELSGCVQRIEALLAGAICASMLAMTLATATWWAALARVAPWVLHGAPDGSHASSFALSLFLPSVLMAIATCLAAFGALASLRGSRLILK
ncbi:MAG TPA: hypothetical protein VG188_08085 [Solirubrobacteraceae bacterium]|jgi:hypothetical protein|nr:hypothetical protein [Solirubrobacteraceae bacterium]